MESLLELSNEVKLDILDGSKGGRWLNVLLVLLEKLGWI